MSGPASHRSQVSKTRSVHPALIHVTQVSKIEIWGHSGIWTRKFLLGSFWLNPVVWGIGDDQMERMLATPADAEIILRLYQLRTEAVMRQARAWVTGEFWPKTAEEFLPCC